MPTCPVCNYRFPEFPFKEQSIPEPHVEGVPAHLLRLELLEELLVEVDILIKNSIMLIGAEKIKRLIKELKN